MKPYKHVDGRKMINMVERSAAKPLNTAALDGAVGSNGLIAVLVAAAVGSGNLIPSDGCFGQ